MPHAFVHLPPPHPATLPGHALLALCQLSRGRSGGPGGQHRNKVETKVTLTHTPSGISAHASERRSQLENKAVALFRLRLALAAGVRCPVAPGEVRTDLWRSRCDASGKLRCNPRHDDYPAMLALALDVLADARWDHAKAALRLACTPSQLVKLIKDDPHAWGVMTAARDEAELHRLQ